MGPPKLCSAEGDLQGKLRKKFVATSVQRAIASQKRIERERERVFPKWGLVEATFELNAPKSCDFQRLRMSMRPWAIDFAGDFDLEVGCTCLL